MAGGRHRKRDQASPRARLVCIYLGESNGEPSALRECATCGAQLLVSAVLLGEVEAGRLSPACRQCNGGRRVKMHPVEVTELTRRGQLEQGWARIIELNAEIAQDYPPTAE